MAMILNTSNEIRLAVAGWSDDIFHVSTSQRVAKIDRPQSHLDGIPSSNLEIHNEIQRSQSYCCGDDIIRSTLN